MRVLIVEDDALTATTMELMLKVENMNVYTTDLGEEAIDLAKLYDYDIILLDLNLPDMSGYEVLRTLRAAKVFTPIMIVSGLTSIEYIVKGLDFGADDYLKKPFHKDELVARIYAVTRRAKGHALSAITVDDLTVMVDKKFILYRGARMHFTGKEYLLLERLALRRGNTVSKERLLEELYGGFNVPDVKILDVMVSKIRKKLGIAANDPLLQTVWGKGYRLGEPEEVYA